MMNKILVAIIFLVLLLILYFTIESSYPIVFYILTSVLFIALGIFFIFEYKKYSKLQKLSNEVDEMFDKYNIKIGGGEFNDLPNEMIYYGEFRSTYIY